MQQEVTCHEKPSNMQDAAHPSCTAASSGTWPSQSMMFAVLHARLSLSMHTTTAFWFDRTASMSGVLPSLSRAETLVTAMARSILTTSICPCRAAQWRELPPSSTVWARAGAGAALATVLWTCDATMEEARALVNLVADPFFDCFFPGIVATLCSKERYRLRFLEAIQDMHSSYVSHECDSVMNLARQAASLVGREPSTSVGTELSQRSCSLEA
jgi:hypothetical protein